MGSLARVKRQRQEERTALSQPRTVGSYVNETKPQRVFKRQRHGQSQRAARDVAETVNCGICFDDFSPSGVVPGCVHRFCSLCSKQYVKTQLREGKFPVNCPAPGCPTKLSTPVCEALLDGDREVHLLRKLELEYSVAEAQKFYCPNPVCSALMVLENARANHPSRCPSCRKQLCTSCRTLWHKNQSCEEFQDNVRRTPSEDTILLNLAEEAKWRQCPQCRQLIELAHGCYHIVCKCGHHFCYKCGCSYTNRHKSCSCLLWDDEAALLDQQFGQAGAVNLNPQWQHLANFVHQAVAAIRVHAVPQAAVQAAPVAPAPRPAPVAHLQPWFPQIAGGVTILPVFAPTHIQAVAAVTTHAVHGTQVGRIAHLPGLAPGPEGPDPAPAPALPRPAAVFQAYAPVHVFQAVPYVHVYGIPHPVNS